MQLDESRLDELVAVAREARDRSHVPYSGFAMGAAALTDRGVVSPGALVENVSLGLATCAERVAMHASVARDEGRPVALALVSARTAGQITWPCGACLQVLSELGGPDAVVVASDLSGERRRARLAELAPHLPRR